MDSIFLKYNLMEISSPDNNLEKAFLVLIHHCYLLPPLRFPISCDNNFVFTR
jgi:hypothetical protein